MTIKGGGSRAPTDPYLFDEFFRTTFVEAVRLAHLLTGDRWAAEDIAQEAYTRLHPRRAGLDNPAAYLRVSLVNAAHSFHRRRGRERARLQRVAPAPGDDVVDAVAVDGGEQELLAAIDRLPYRQKAVVVLRYYQDLSEAEIAEALGCRPGTIKSLASRALTRLSKDWAREFVAGATGITAISVDGRPGVLIESEGETVAVWRPTDDVVVDFRASLDPAGLLDAMAALQPVHEATWTEVFDQPLAGG